MIDVIKHKYLTRDRHYNTDDVHGKLSHVSDAII